MEVEEFRNQGHKLVDWMADYMENISEYPVKSQVRPGEIMAKLQELPPENGEKFEEIMRDFEENIMPGITHWQSPSFFAYFPAASSAPSVLAEMLTATIGAQCMVWETSPAAAEMEERVMEWLKKMMKLPTGWSGVIQDTASTATLVALLTARQKLIKPDVNSHGFPANKFRAYCSNQAHSSVDKAVRMAGIGSENLIKIEVDENYAMRPDKLTEAIENDIQMGFTPLFVVGAIGTTGSTAIDPVDEIGEICQQFDCWFHIDAAYAGTAFILNDFRSKFKKLELADSFVFNPHKWMFTNFDCSAYFVKNKADLIDTFSLTPEYLKTRDEGSVNNYKDWGIQLGRRFRALKLWIVIRSFGVSEIKKRIQEHIDIGQWFANQVKKHPDFELLAPVPLNTVCFRFNPEHEKLSKVQLNDLNERIMHTINDSGAIYFTHTILDGKFTLRIVTGQSNVKKEHVENAWEIIKKTAESINYQS